MVPGFKSLDIRILMKCQWRKNKWEIHFQNRSCSKKWTVTVAPYIIISLAHPMKQIHQFCTEALDYLIFLRQEHQRPLSPVRRPLPPVASSCRWVPTPCSHLAMFGLRESPGKSISEHLREGSGSRGSLEFSFWVVVVRNPTNHSAVSFG